MNEEEYLNNTSLKRPSSSPLYYRRPKQLALPSSSNLTSECEPSETFGDLNARPEQRQDICYDGTTLQKAYHAQYQLESKVVNRTAGVQNLAAKYAGITPQQNQNEGSRNVLPNRVRRWDSVDPHTSRNPGFSQGPSMPGPVRDNYNMQMKHVQITETKVQVEMTAPSAQSQLSTTSNSMDFQVSDLTMPVLSPVELERIRHIMKQNFSMEPSSTITSSTQSQLGSMSNPQTDFIQNVDIRDMIVPKRNTKPFEGIKQDQFSCASNAQATCFQGPQVRDMIMPKTDLVSFEGVDQVRQDFNQQDIDTSTMPPQSENNFNSQPVCFQDMAFPIPYESEQNVNEDTSVSLPPQYHFEHPSDFHNDQFRDQNMMVSNTNQRHCNRVNQTRSNFNNSAITGPGSQDRFDYNFRHRDQPFQDMQANTFPNEDHLKPIRLNNPQQRFGKSAPGQRFQDMQANTFPNENRMKPIRFNNCRQRFGKSAPGQRFQDMQANTFPNENHMKPVRFNNPQQRFGKSAPAGPFRDKYASKQMSNMHDVYSEKFNSQEEPPSKGDLNHGVITKNFTSKFLRCRLCFKEFSSRQEINEHFAGELHSANKKILQLKKTAEYDQALRNSDPNHSTSSNAQKEMQSLTDMHIEIDRCDVCVKSFTCLKLAKEHFASKLHLTNVNRMNDEKRNTNRFFCKPCMVSSPSLQLHNQHINGTKHFSILNHLKEGTSSKDANKLPDAESAKTIICEVCHVYSGSLKMHIQHVDGNRHHRAVAELERMNISKDISKLDSADIVIPDAKEQIMEATSEKGLDNVEGLFSCNVCKVNSPTLQLYNQHINGMEHLTNIEEFEDGTPSCIEDTISPISAQKPVYTCEICNVVTVTRKMHRQHMNGSRHSNKVKEIESVNITNDSDQRRKGPRYHNHVQELRANIPRICSFCHVSVCSVTDLQAHLVGQWHRRKIEVIIKVCEEISSIREGSMPNESLPNSEADEHFKGNGLQLRAKQIEKDLPTFCSLCNMSLNTAFIVQTHLQGSRHSDILEEIKQICLRKYAHDKNTQGSEQYSDLPYSNFKNKPLRSGKPKDMSMCCAICNITVDQASDFHKHLVGAKHKRKLVEQDKSRGEKKADDNNGEFRLENKNVPSSSKGLDEKTEKRPKFSCHVCGIHIISDSEALSRHLNGPKHLKNMLKVSSNESRNSANDMHLIDADTELKLRKLRPDLFDPNTGRFLCSGQYYCAVCDVVKSSESSALDHNMTWKHIISSTQ